MSDTPEVVIPVEETKSKKVPVTVKVMRLWGSVRGGVLLVRDMKTNEMREIPASVVPAHDREFDVEKSVFDSSPVPAFRR